MTASEKLKILLAEVIREELQPLINDINILKESIEVNSNNITSMQPSMISETPKEIKSAAKSIGSMGPTLDALKSIVSDSARKGAAGQPVIESLPDVSQLDTTSSAGKAAAMMFKDHSKMLDAMDKAVKKGAL